MLGGIHLRFNVRSYCRITFPSLKGKNSLTTPALLAQSAMMNKKVLEGKNSLIVCGRKLERV